MLLSSHVRVVTQDRNGHQHHLDVERTQFAVMFNTLNFLTEKIKHPVGTPISEATHEALAVLQDLDNVIRVDLSCREGVSTPTPLTRLVISVNDSPQAIRDQLCQYLGLANNMTMTIPDLYMLLTGNVQNEHYVDVVVSAPNGRPMIQGRWVRQRGLCVAGHHDLVYPHPTWGYRMHDILIEHHQHALLNHAPYYLTHLEPV